MSNSVLSSRLNSREEWAELQFRLARQLRLARLDAGLTGLAVARASGMSNSKLSKIEHQRLLPTVDDISALARVFGLDDATAAQMQEDALRLSMLRPSRSVSNVDQPPRSAPSGLQDGWWSEYSEVLSADACDYLAICSDAIELFRFNADFIYGLLQTRDYTTAVVMQPTIGASSLHSVERFLEMRLERKRQFLENSDVMLRSVLDESVLRRHVGHSQILREQIEHLLELSSHPRVEIQVRPFAAQRIYAGTESCGFTICKNGQEFGHSENTIRPFANYRDEPTLQYLKALWRTASAQALDATDSASFMKQLIGEL